MNFKTSALGLVILLCSVSTSMGQRSLKPRQLSINARQLDTLLIFNPRTYVSIKNGQADYLHSPELSEIVTDSLFFATEKYFSDTLIQFSERDRKNPVPILFTYYDSLKNDQINDSIYTFISKLKQGPSRIQTTAPKYFVDLLKQANQRFGLLIFQYGYLKSDAFYKRQIAGTIAAALLTRGNWFEVSEYHSELTCCIIDSEQQTLVFYGSTASKGLPLNVATQVEHFHSLFDRSLRNKKKNLPLQP